MASTPSAALATIEVESALLSALIDSTTAREGATAVLDAIAPLLESDAVFGDSSVAIAAHEREGALLHLLAERGAPRTWPTTLEPRFALSEQAGIDAASGALVVPLRANGRVVGALLCAGAANAASAFRDPAAARLLAFVAAALDALVTRAGAAVRRRAAALRSVESVIEGMAHQMANPMTGASAIAQILAEELTDSGQRAAVNQIRVELNRAFAVLQDLQETRRDTGALAGVLDLNTVVEDIARFRGYAIREQGITLDVETLQVTAPVRADARRIEHALLMALRHAEQQSNVSVNRSVSIRVVERPMNEVAIEVTDSGPGTVPEFVVGYFDLRFDEDPASDAPGPDLGLVNSLLRASGGRLEARGSKTAGTTLSLVLPRDGNGSHSIPGLTQ